MSCGSTTRIPDDILEIPARSFPRLSPLWRALLAGLDGLSLHWERRHQRRQLLELDDRLLADIGLTRRQTAEEAAKSFMIRHLFR
jgi:uncharacterized protein YjiS (DUF1127 family)